MTDAPLTDAAAVELTRTSDRHPCRTIELLARIWQVSLTSLVTGVNGAV